MDAHADTESHQNYNINLKKRLPWINPALRLLLYFPKYFISLNIEKYGKCLFYIKSFLR